jgi:hypothetical protein
MPDILAQNDLRRVARLPVGLSSVTAVCQLRARVGLTVGFYTLLRHASTLFGLSEITAFYRRFNTHALSHVSHTEE